MLSDFPRGFLSLLPHVAHHTPPCHCPAGPLRHGQGDALHKAEESVANGVGDPGAVRAWATQPGEPFLNLSLMTQFVRNLKINETSEKNLKII